MTNLEQFNQTRLLAKDFDETVALTFESSPNGLDVDLAYELAIEDVFGPDALQAYQASGGLQNRAPREVVEQLAPEASTAEIDEQTELLVQAKLDVLIGEISPIWPRPTNGYLEFKDALSEALNAGRLIDDIIVSSGHQPFIEKVYAMWDIEMPGHIVATEATKHAEFTATQLIKPSPYLMELTRDLWRSDYGLTSGDASADEVDRILYVGDDPDKDGQLARNSEVTFQLLDSGHSRAGWREVAVYLGIGSFMLKGVSS